MYIYPRQLQTRNLRRNKQLKPVVTLFIVTLLNLIKKKYLRNVIQPIWIFKLSPWSLRFYQFSRANIDREKQILPYLSPVTNYLIFKIYDRIDGPIDRAKSEYRTKTETFSFFFFFLLVFPEEPRGLNYEFYNSSRRSSIRKLSLFLPGEEEKERKRRKLRFLPSGRILASSDRARVWIADRMHRSS